MSEHPQSPQPRQPVWWKRPIDVSASPEMRELVALYGEVDAQRWEDALAAQAEAQQARPARVGDGVGDGEVSHAA